MQSIIFVNKMAKFGPHVRNPPMKIRWTITLKNLGQDCGATIWGVVECDTY